MSYSGDLLRFSSKSKEQSYAIHQKVTVDLYTKVIVSTPVQDGRAKGNWVATYNHPLPSELSKMDKLGQETTRNMISDVGEFDGIKAKTVFLTNNVPYILRLEYEGHSPQQPNGWVKKAVLEAKV